MKKLQLLSFVSFMMLSIIYSQESLIIKDLRNDNFFENERSLSVSPQRLISTTQSFQNDWQNNNGNAQNVLKSDKNSDVTVLIATPTEHYIHILMPRLLQYEGISYTVTRELGNLTVEEMLSYDVMWTFNLNPWDYETGINSIEWGNKVNDFLDAGGYLLESLLVNSHDGYSLQGSAYIDQDKSPFNPATLRRPYREYSMGDILEPMHPIMAGVTTVGTDYIVENVTLKSDATLICRWGGEFSDPLVAIKNNGRVVAFNASPLGAVMAGVYPCMSGDGYKLFHNALIWLNNNKIAPDVPFAASDVTLLAHPTGGLSLFMEWKNPSTTIAGETLTELAYVNIHENGAPTPIHTIYDPPIGEMSDHSHAVPALGMYRYSFVPVNSAGVGFPISAAVWIGPDVPSAPRNLTLANNDLNAIVTWNAPITGLHGGYFTQTGLVYDVIRMPGNVLVSSNQTATTFSEPIAQPDHYLYKVIAKNGIGEGGIATSNILAFCMTINTSYDPWNEGFEGLAFPPACWENVSVEGSRTWLVSTYVSSGSYSAYHYPSQQEMVDTWLISPLITLPNSGNLLLEFWSQTTLGINYHISEVLVSTSSSDPFSGTFEVIKNLSGAELESGWQKITVSLHDYYGEEIYIAFRYAGLAAHYWYIDDIRVINFYEYVEAELSKIITPVEGIYQNLGSNEPVKILIKNNGSDPLSDFGITLKVLKDDNLIETYNETFQGSIPSLSQAEYTFTNTLDLIGAGIYEIIITLNVPDDRIPENNTKTVTLTSLNCIPISIFPYNEGFEENGPDFKHCWNQETDDYNHKWEVVTEGYGYGIPPSVYNGEYKAFFWHGAGAKTKLVMPPFDISTLESPALRFWHTQGVFYGQDYLRVYYKNSNESKWILLASYSDAIYDWKEEIVPLPNKSNRYYIAFEAESKLGGAVQLDDITVDDFSMYIDIQPTVIKNPNSDDYLFANENVTVTIKNNSSITVTNFDIILELDGEVVATEKFTGFIESLQQADFIFNAKLNLSEQKTYTVKVTTDIENDEVPANNSLTKSVTYLDSDIRLYGFRIDESPSNAQTLNFVTFDINSPQTVDKLCDYKPSGVANQIYSGDFVDDYFYGYTVERNGAEVRNVNFVKIDTKTWKEVHIIPIPEMYSPLPFDMTYDYTTGTMYGIASFKLYAIDIETNEWTEIGSIAPYMPTLACSLDGELFGISYNTSGIPNSNGMLWKIDKTDASVTAIGNTGVDVRLRQSMTFDRCTGKLLWAMRNDNRDSKLLEVDTQTGAVTDFGNIKNTAHIVALYTKPAKVVITQPADNATEVSLNTPVSVTFNKRVTEIDLSQITVNDELVTAELTGNILNITDMPELTCDTKYTVNIPAGAVMGYDDDITWSFTTGNVSIKSNNISNIKIYPNPSNGKVNIFVNENSNVKIFDITGKIVGEYNISGLSTIDIKQPNGVYFVKIETVNNVSVHKLIIKK